MLQMCGWYIVRRGDELYRVNLFSFYPHLEPVDLTNTTADEWLAQPHIFHDMYGENGELHPIWRGCLGTTLERVAGGSSFSVKLVYRYPWYWWRNRAFLVLRWLAAIVAGVTALILLILLVWRIGVLIGTQ